MTIRFQWNRVRAITILCFLGLIPNWLSAHGDIEMRIATLSRKISAATNDVTLYLARGDLHREHQDWAAAAADYDQAAKIQPDLVAVDLCRGRLLAAMDRLAEAEAKFSKVIVQAPQEGEAFIGRARVLLKLNRRSDAISDYRKGLDKISKPQPEYYLELADTFVVEQRSIDALHSLDEGINRLGPIILLHEKALQLELAENDLEAALHRVDQILQVAARKENWLVRRGDILMLLNRDMEAQVSLKSALKAIDALPPVLQKGPNVLQLINHARTSLAQLRPSVAADK